MSPGIKHDVLRIFLASPGDVQEERDRAQALVDELNEALADSLQCQLRLLKWESVEPGYGRPQEIINRKVDRCDIFLGLLHRRWGQPTGADYTSGFEEEFERALERRRDTGDPEIMIIFKTVEHTDDPGPQLQQVLEFKERLREQREVLYREVDSVNEWEEKLRKWLLRHFANIASDLGRAQNAEFDATEDMGRRPRETGTETPLNGQAADSLPGQVIEAAERVVTRSNQTNITSLYDLIYDVEGADIVRLYLATATGFRVRLTEEPLSTHDANSIFNYRHTIQPSASELSLLFRSMLHDSNVLIPGWYWFQHTTAGLAELLSWIAMFDRKSTVRTRAVDLLTRARVHPDNLPENYWGHVSVDGDSDVQSAVLSYLRSVPDPDPGIELLDNLRGEGTTFDDVDLNLTEDALQIRRDANAQLLEHLTDEVVDDLIVDAFMGDRDDLDTDTLLDSVDANSSDIRLLVVGSLLERGELTVDDARSLTEDDDHRIRALAYRRLVDSEEEDVTASVIVSEVEYQTKLKISRQYPDWIQELGVAKWDLLADLFRQLSFEEIRDAVGWTASGPAAYRVLATEYFQPFQEQLRADFNNDFRRVRKETLDQIEQDFSSQVREAVNDRWKEEIDGFLRLQFSASALAGLAEHGEPQDIEYAYDYLDASYEFVIDEAIKVVRRFGSETDADRLVTVARNSYGATRTLSLDTALELTDDPHTLWRELLELEDSRVISETIRVFSRHGYEFEAPLRWLLKNSDKLTRECALAALVRSQDDEEMGQMLATYTENESYYYDVVAWLDRLQYAPLPLNDSFQSELLAKLE